MWGWNSIVTGTAVAVAASFVLGTVVSAPVPPGAAPAVPEMRGTFVAAATEIRADERGHFFATAEIDSTAIDVLVDTGASAVALSYEDAERAGLHPRSLSFDVAVNTANGVTMAARVKLRRVELAGVTVHDVEGLVLPEGQMRGTLLGMSFLSRLRSFTVEDGVLKLRD